MKIKLTQKKGIEYLCKLSKAWNGVTWSILYLPSDMVELEDNGKFQEVIDLIKQIFGEEN